MKDFKMLPGAADGSVELELEETPEPSTPYGDAPYGELVYGSADEEK